jgi:raffinose/stachyose/melibiose transport system substrate-binding protein
MKQYQYGEVVRRTAIILVIMLYVFTLSACGGLSRPVESEEPPIKLSLWGWIGSGSMEEKVLIQAAVHEFNENNPYNTIIDYQTFNDEFKIKISTETAANNAPDMFFTWEEGFLAPFVKSGNVVPLDSIIDKSKFIPGILDHVTMDGKVYAMPLVQTAQMVYYNKALFSKYDVHIPQTMEQMLEAVRTFREEGVVPIALANKDIWSAGLILNMLAYRHGGPKIFEKAVKGDIAFTDPSFLQAAKDFEQLVKLGAFEPNANSTDMDLARRQFMEGKAAMWVMGSWELSVLTAEQQEDGSPNPLYGNVDFFNWPAVEDGATGQDAWIISPDYNIAVSRNVAHPEAAAAFLKLISSEKYQNVLESISLLPATNLVVHRSTQNPSLAEIYRQIGKAKESITFPDRIMGQQTIGGAVNNSAQQLLVGRDAESTMYKLEERAAVFRKSVSR